MLKRCAIPVFLLAFFVFSSPSVFACGGLVAPDGDVHLARASTLVAWHAGIEHYLTTFTYQGTATHLGWIVPLPAVPLKIEQGGAWTLQRLSLATHPQPTFAVAGTSASASPAQVLQQVQIEALDISVVKGSGQAIVDWAEHNGFSLDGDTREHLLIYAQASPIFMAARFDLTAAKARHQLSGDGTPILITMPTPRIWVPLEVLALDGQDVHADLYLLTDHPLNISDVALHLGQSPIGSQIPGTQGFEVAYQQPVSSELYHDLSTDRNMAWVHPGSWLTYLSLDAPAASVTYDMGVSTTGVIHLAPFGTSPLQVAEESQTQVLPPWFPIFPLGTPQFTLAFVVLILVLASGMALLRYRRKQVPLTKS